MKFGSHKTTLLAIFLSAYFSLGVASCPKNIPPAPEIWQCQLNKPKGGDYAFYCVNNKTFEKMKVPLSAPSLKGAQCLRPSDFKSMEGWVSDLALQAQERCK